MGVTLAGSGKAYLDEDDSISYKRKERLLIIGVIIIFAVYIVVNIIYNLQSILSIFLIPSNSILIPHIESIKIKSTSVVKSAHAYFVTIIFVNDGARNTSIDSVLLNGVPYNDPRWTGTIKPMVFGDLTPKFHFIDVDASYVGILEFSDDCKDSSGNKLMVGGDDHYNIM